MKVYCIWEHNGNDSLVYAQDCIGAFTRGSSKEEALAKMDREIRSYLQWRDGLSFPVDETIEAIIIQEKASELRIADADSDVLFESEKRPLLIKEYLKLKELAIKSARDFQRLFDAIPDKNRTALSVRETFYGQVPITAQQMYDHTSGVNSYYFGEIGIRADRATNSPTDSANYEAGIIVTRRLQSFEQLEITQTGVPNYLANRLFNGSYGEEWTLRKVCRRFVWHDRIHAKAMYRMACKTFGAETVPNIFGFLI
ncbi:MAG TPA: hypothetical protein DHD79_02150 [Firmicutes bacterium]|nr:hypothetical protein [Bacillota bacterium]HBG44948.1 hypothetical protein [Bacillota bacterium]HBL50062.1 hypothetical protein [Bacillota bacterium]HBL67378.1 hypothetical protein [Bacillota bacterium]HBR25381.1 hypothetical protein [Bacillota bacterium]